MKVGTRLFFGFGLLIISLLFIASVGIVKLSSMNDALVNTVDFGSTESRLLAKAISEAQQSALAMHKLIILTDLQSIKSQKTVYDTHIQSYIATVDKLDDLLKRDPSNDQRALILFENARQARLAAMPIVNKAAQLGETNDTSSAEFLMSNASPALDKWINTLEEFGSYTTQNNLVRAERAHASYYSARLLVVVLTLLALVLAVIAGWRITRGILRELGGEPSYAGHLVSEIADGNLSIAVNLSPNDQSSLLYSMNSMRSKLLDTIGGIRSATDHIATASREIAVGNTDLSARTEQQAASLEETAASMAQLTQAVRQNTDNAKEANTLASRATGVANAGDLAVQDLANTIGEINASSGKISQITGVIESIAFQTNILALNAAVEAARAGDQGRGFAVVASEVRSLAQRSALAAKEIKDLITTSVAMIDGGVRRATEASSAVSEVKQAIKQVSELVEEITAASEEQARGIEQVNEAVNQMDDVTQQNAALVEQAAAAAKSLEDQSNVLVQSVSVFHIGETVPSSNYAKPRDRLDRNVHGDHMKVSSTRKEFKSTSNPVDLTPPSTPFVS
ncbi:methyl-accepting chemotaxis protein [Paraburkholderia tropica]